ncbi:MAG: nucleotidyltransferase domain-containing protein [Nitrospirae bacterium]|nr:nucleotidyltransferase domain-containing protein [Nitrospirota bacterium]
MKTVGNVTMLDRLIRKASADNDVLAVILFGSAARNETTSLSDKDICIVLLPKAYESTALSHKKLEYLSEYDFDIHVYQQLPIYIKHRVIKEGRVLFCRDEDALYKLVFRTIEEFEDYKYFYEDYLEKVADAR